jgi:hypothetical protein
VDTSGIEAAVRTAAKTLRRDGAKVAVAHSLTARLLRELAEERACALHVPGFFAPRLAARAARTLAALGRHETWVVGGRKTDTQFNIGIPLQIGEDSPRATARYLREARKANLAVRDAFAPSASPLDALRLQLDELWPHGARLGRVQQSPALAGLVRTVSTATLMPGAAGRLGMIHVDETRASRRLSRKLSANLYLAVPRSGGALRIWDVAVSASNAKNLVHRLCSRYGFEPDSQALLHDVLGEPTVIHPRPGDLVLLDTARPHAVGGFRRGVRISLQSWVTVPAKAGPLVVFA